MALPGLPDDAFAISAGLTGSCQVELDDGVSGRTVAQR